MRVENIEDLRKWAKEGNRSVDITIGDINNQDHFKIWCYDYEYQAGVALYKLPGEIDIKKAAKRQYEGRKAELEEKLKKLEAEDD